MSVQKVIYERHKRRTRPPRRHVRWAKISNRRHTRPPGNDARLANLKGRSHAPAEKPRRHALMKNRLPVRPDQRNLAHGNAPVPASRDGRTRKLFAEQKIKLANLSSGVGRA